MSSWHESLQEHLGREATCSVRVSELGGGRGIKTAEYELWGPTSYASQTDHNYPVPSFCTHMHTHTHSLSLSFSLSSSQSVSEAQTLWLTNYLEPQSNFLMAAKNVWKAPEQRGGRLGQTRFTLLSYRTCTWPELFRWNEDFQVWFSFIRHWHLWHKKTRIF